MKNIFKRHLTKLEYYKHGMQRDINMLEFEVDSMTKSQKSIDLFQINVIKRYPSIKGILSRSLG